MIDFVSDCITQMPLKSYLDAINFKFFTKRWFLYYMFFGKVLGLYVKILFQFPILNNVDWKVIETSQLSHPFMLWVVLLGKCPLFLKVVPRCHKFLKTTLSSSSQKDDFYIILVCSSERFWVSLSKFYFHFPILNNIDWKVIETSQSNHLFMLRVVLLLKNK